MNPLSPFVKKTLQKTVQTTPEGDQECRGGRILLMKRPFSVR